MNDSIIQIPVTSLREHPDNPRLEPRQDVIDQIAKMIANGFDQSHALIVREIEDGSPHGFYQIVSGHHRWMAAKQANLQTVPCWVREMDDATAHMALVLNNTQSELHPLEEGKHAAASVMDLKAYAEWTGKVYTTLHTKVMAFRVFDVTNIRNAEARENWLSLSVIHAAPDWLWPALAEKMIEKEWTVEITRKAIKNLKTGKGTMPEWMQLQAIGKALIDGDISQNEIETMINLVDNAKVSSDN
ncbi:ParB family transcriptional regulator, chromosome partitioning protein [Gammaproteobacteria bacterium]